MIIDSSATVNEEIGDNIIKTNLISWDLSKNV